MIKKTKKNANHKVVNNIPQCKISELLKLSMEALVRKTVASNSTIYIYFNVRG